MCGAYSLLLAKQDIIDAFDVTSVRSEPVAKPMFRPTVHIPAISLADGVRTLDNYRWGFEWFMGDTKKNTFNSRVETVATSRMFKSAFEGQRCLLPASGFYEWKTVEADGKTTKQKILFTISDDSPFAFAGIWRSQKVDKIETSTLCASMLTTVPSAIMEGIHDRMPVILHKYDYELWLDPSVKGKDLLSLLLPYPAEKMKFAIAS